MNNINRIFGTDRIHAQGITGRGITVAIFDTGIYKHPDLGARIIGFRDTFRRRTFPYDDNGHGTHIAGIIGSDGRMSNGAYAGVAPECRIVSVKVLDRYGNGNIKEFVDGINWVIANRIKYNIRVANISVGASPEKSGEDSELVRAADRLWNCGITVVTAAGNNGPGMGTVTAPGISRKVITVGACDDNIAVMINGNRVVNYSGRGPTENCIKKPDIVAPANGIISTAPITKSMVTHINDCYTKKSGTSMATPIVTGAVTLLLCAYPGLTNKEVKICIRNSARNLGFSHAKQGWGMLDIEGMLRQGKMFTNFQQ